MWPLASVAIIFAFNGLAGDPWGTPVAGVRLGISIADGAPSEVRVAVKNVSETPILVPLGALIGPRFHDLAFRVRFVTDDGKERRVIYTGGPGHVGGRLDPLAVALIPNAIYSVGLPFDKLYVLDGSEKLETFLRRHPGQLTVELNIQNPRCPLYGPPNPNMIPCWQGKVVSNTLQVPDAHPH